MFNEKHMSDKGTMRITKMPLLSFHYSNNTSAKRKRTMQRTSSHRKEDSAAPTVTGSFVVIQRERGLYDILRLQINQLVLQHLWIERLVTKINSLAIISTVLQINQSQRILTKITTKKQLTYSQIKRNTILTCCSMRILSHSPMTYSMNW